MKKALLLSLTILLFSCGGDDDTNSEPETNEPTSIKFTLEEIWGVGINYNYQNTEQRVCSLDDRKYLRISEQGESVFGQNISTPLHNSIDTLRLSLYGASNIDPNLINNFGFNLGPLNQANTEQRVNPQYINHIELIDFDENDRIFLKQGFMEYYYPINSTDSNLNKKIVYFSSNVSEEFLNSIVYTSENVNDFCPSTEEEIFVKKSQEEYNSIRFLELTIPYNIVNNSFNVGDEVSGQDIGSLNQVNNLASWTITYKEYID